MNMGHVIADIQDLYDAGYKPDQIATKTKSSIDFVLDVVKEIQINEAYADFPEER